MHLTRPLLGLLFLLVSALAWADAAPVPAAPGVSAKAYFLQDFHSGYVLAEENGDERLEPASLTKIMTAYVVSHELKEGHIHLDDKVRVSEKAWRTGGSRMFIEVGTEVSVEDLLKGMIVQSGNDASVALAEHVAGSEEAFAELMNREAKRLGMTNSHFVNATGLPDPNHYTTARDLARLSAALIRDFPDHYAWHSIHKFTYNNITQYNRNRLLWRDDSVDGVKTGHTSTAGYCLVASAKRDDMRLISVLMGAKSDSERASESQKLLNYGFRFYETHRLYEAAKPLSQVRVWKGAREAVAVGLRDDLYVTVPRDQYDKLSATMEVDPRIVAPVIKGARKGTLKISLSGKELLDRPLIALDSVPVGSLWQRLTDAVRLMFH